ncbi:MAG: hypothetical protein U0892_06950 [Pirellulales bacterium]
MVPSADLVTAAFASSKSLTTSALSAATAVDCFLASFAGFAAGPLHPLRRPIALHDAKRLSAAKNSVRKDDRRREGMSCIEWPAMQMGDNRMGMK